MKNLVLKLTKPINASYWPTKFCIQNCLTLTTYNITISLINFSGKYCQGFGEIFWPLLLLQLETPSMYVHTTWLLKIRHLDMPLDWTLGTGWHQPDVIFTSTALLQIYTYCHFFETTLISLLNCFLVIPWVRINKPPRGVINNPYLYPAYSLTVNFPGGGTLQAGYKYTQQFIVNLFKSSPAV